MYQRAVKVQRMKRKTNTQPQDGEEGRKGRKRRKKRSRNEQRRRNVRERKGARNEGSRGAAPVLSMNKLPLETLQFIPSPYSPCTYIYIT